MTVSNLRTSALTVLLTAAIVFASCNAVEGEMLAGPSLIQHLRQGGYVLLMRHAHAPVETPDKRNADAANPKLERQLDESGRNTARAMGEAIRKLHIPIGAVFSSPTYRALETLRLAALGPARTYAELGDGGRSMNADAVADQAGWLRIKVAELPKPATNTIIVTHMPNIQSAFNQDATGLTDGEMMIFRSGRHGKAELVAKIKIEDWPSLARN